MLFKESLTTSKNKSKRNEFGSVYRLNILTYYGIGNIIGNDSYVCKEV